jgi:phosphoribosylformylglycinamidine cyclo-ligase
VRARIDPASWPRPPLFDLLQREGGIDDEEMLRVFNCGIGMVLVVPPEQANDILDRLRGLGERAYRIGQVEVKAPDEAPLLFGPIQTQAGE